jgi:hypothetical protein
MAFELISTEETVHFDVLQDGNSYAFLGRVGRDLDRGSNYFVHIGLDPTPGMGLEYYFALVEVESATGHEHWYWSGKDVAQLIGQNDRNAILAVVLRGTAALLDFVKPNQVHRCTRDHDLPAPALEKHTLISVVFARCGYEVGRTDLYHGKRFWTMERKSSS